MLMTPTTDARRDESGSLIIAMAVIMVLTSLSIAVLARTLNGLNNSRQGQEILAAQAAADAGVADALFQLDNPAGGLDAAAPLSIPLSPAPPQSGTLGSASFRYRATRQGDDNSYLIVSIGTSGAMNHSVSALATRTPRYPFALFADHGITFNGASASSYRSFPTSGIYAEADGMPDSSSSAAKIGSNHAIVLASRTGGGDVQMASGPAGSCSGLCAPPLHAGRIPDP